MSILSSSSVTNPSLAVSGLVSGIDTGKVIEGLLAIEQQKISVIDAKKARVQTQQAAFKGIEARLLALQGQMTQLSRSQNGVFDARTAQSSDTDILTAAAGRTAVPGVYHVRVGSLARANQIASQGFDRLDSAVTHGAIQIRVGDNTTTITVDSSNDTLEGLANAINNSAAPVNASIVNDGSGDDMQGYRLLLSSRATGTANRIVLTNNLEPSGNGITKPAFDTGTIGHAMSLATNSGTAVIQSNAGSGYVGATNSTITFTVLQGGTVGTDGNLVIGYSNATGGISGTITLDPGDVDTLKNVAQGIQVKFAAGTLVAGDQFTVKGFVPTVQDATDATVTLGSGDGALMVTSANNQVDTVIPGVTLQLLAANLSKDIAVTVENDTQKMGKAIQDFVAAFNETMGFIDQQIRYDASTGQAGPLLGSRQAIAIQDQVRSALADVVTGANPQLNHIGALGISFNEEGRLIVDDKKLSAVLGGNRPGVSLDDVRRLFALSGTSDTPEIQFVTGSTRTRASVAPYTVQVSQAAERANLIGALPLPPSTVIDTANNTLVIGVDGATSTTLTLPAGTYSRLALAQAVQGAINGDPTLLGRKANVSLSNDALAISSLQYGSASQIRVIGGSALSALGFSSGLSAQGRDVIGTFAVGGTVEPARGNGQFLLGHSENDNTADLQVRVNLTSAQVGTGITASLQVSRGVASRLDRVLTNLFDPVNGRLKSLDGDFQSSLQSLDAQKSRQAEIMQSRQEQLQKQFAAMERVLAELQGASNLISAQASSISQKK